MRRFVVLLLLVALCASFSPATRAEDTPGVPPGEFMGMVIRDPHYEWKTNPKYPNGVNQDFYDEMGRNLAAAGVKWVRLEIFTEEANVTGSPELRGKVNVEKYRYFIDVVAPRHGFKVLALLATPLVRQRPVGDPQHFPDDPRDPNDSYGAGAYIDPEQIEDPLGINGGPDYGFVNGYMHIWLDNAFTVANAFPYNAATGRGIAAFEVLNEENRYLNGGGRGLRPSDVATMLTKFYRVYRKGGPAGKPVTGDHDQVKIILGGLHPDRCDDCRKADGTLGMNDRQYLEAIYKSGAFQSYRNTNGKYPLDGIGYHPYPTEMQSGLVPEGGIPEGEHGYYHLFRIPSRIEAMRKVMVDNGDTVNKFWVTEIGDRGAPVLGDPATSPRMDNEVRQANFMRSVYWMLWQDREFVEHVFWFKYEDFAVPRNSTIPGNWNFGVVRVKPDPETKYDYQDPHTKWRITTRYDVNGTVQRFKESYRAYQDIAANGLPTFRTYIPMSASGVTE